LECIQETDGFELGKSYKCIGVSGKYLEMIDNNGGAQIMDDTYFKVGKKK